MHRRQLRWLVLGMAALAVAAGLAVGIWAVQDSDGTGTTPEGGRAGLEAPGAETTESSTLSDSVEIEVKRGSGTNAGTLEESTDSPSNAPAGTPGPGDAALMGAGIDGRTTETVSVTESALVERRSGGATTETASLTDSADVEVVRAPPPPPPPPPAGGGRGAGASVDESVRFVIRDSSGEIKEQGIAQ